MWLLGLAGLPVGDCGPLAPTAENALVFGLVALSWTLNASLDRLDLAPRRLPAWFRLFARELPVLSPALGAAYQLWLVQPQSL